MENKIHPTAIIDKSVKLGSGNEIGPYCVLTGDISLGNGNVFRSHVVMHGHGPINIGNNNDFFSFVAFGVPQDKKFKGENGIINIGNNNTFREYSTVNAGTESGIMKTIIGNNCLFLMSSHVAHDCVLGDEIILSNNVALAGHVEVGDYVIIGGLSAVHQFTRIGKHAMIGGMSAVSGDVIPYGMVVGERAYLSGLNLVGLKRRKFPKDVMQQLRSAYESIFAKSHDLNFASRIDLAKKEFQNSIEALDIIDFIDKNASASRSLCKPR